MKRQCKVCQRYYDPAKVRSGVPQGICTRACALDAKRLKASSRQWGDVNGACRVCGEPRPFGWENSIGRFAELGLEDFTITAAVDTAMRARVRDTFSYFCGICWNIYRERQTIAADIIEQGGADGAT